MEKQASDARSLRNELGKSEYSGKYGDVGQYIAEASEKTGLGTGGASTYDVNESLYEAFGPGGVWENSVGYFTENAELATGNWARKDVSKKDASMQDFFDDMMTKSGASVQLGLFTQEDQAELYRKAMGGVTGADPEERRASFVESAKSVIGQELSSAGITKVTGGIDATVAATEAAAKLAADNATAAAKAAADKTAAQEDAIARGQKDLGITNVNVNIVQNADGSTDAAVDVVNGSGAGTENEQATNP